MFTIQDGGGRPFWASTDGSSTYYPGQLVTYVMASKAIVTGGAVKPLAVPAGAADTTNFQVIAGIVTAVNNRTPVSTTVGSYTVPDYAAGVTTQAAQLARDWVNAEGMYLKSDPQVLVEITPIYPGTLLKGSIFNAAYGTAISLLTNTAADTTGGTSAFATNACDFTPVASLATTYCRTGQNMGMYRKSNDTSTTAPANAIAFPYDIAVGDTFVRVPLAQGISYIYIGGPGLYIDGSLGGATNYFIVYVEQLDLRESGKECAYFHFASCHFDPARA